MLQTRREWLQTSAVTLASAGLLWPSLANAADGPYADAVLVNGEPPLPKPGSFTVAVLPDTQNYSEKFPQTFTAQTSWLAAEQQRRNIAFVLHLGDITNRSSEPEWKNAVASMDVLHGKIPYAMVPGNHDYSEGGSCSDRQSRMSEFFPVARFQEQATFGGTYDREPERTENSYHRFSAGGRKFLVIALEFGPRKDVVRWANEIAAKHQDHEAILITHAYMYFDETRYDWKKYGTKQNWNPHAYGVAKSTGDDVLDGEELWNQLVSRHENFIMTLNGHVLGDGLGRLITQTPKQRDVHQMLVNFQMKPKGGDGWLRLLEFQPDGKTVLVYDYSPVLKSRNESSQNQFQLSLAKIG
ncbi:metallophosphoesterase [Planctomicrobium sp. SH527]|uniref:metallophosphoesterase n=1 Tax=Planctomicrobium sp. SH527 TaxID=3448123 RepID=UPI003F5B9174